MKLKNIDFGPVIGQSGVQGFFGEGDEYPHHKWYKRIPWFTFRGMTFVAKTTSVNPREAPERSNTELKEEYKLKHFLPTSIWVTLRSFLGGYMLNAMGIPTPGLKKLLLQNKWQNRREPFQLSYMPEGASQEDKVQDAQACADLLLEYLPPNGRHRYGIQINVSCPNTEHKNQQAIDEIVAVTKVFNESLPNVPLILKVDFNATPEFIIALKSCCDAFCVSNTIAFGNCADRINWNSLFKNGESPLVKHFGDKFKGGLSGVPLFPILKHWLYRMEEVDPNVTIIAGGGIMSKSDIDELSKFKIVHAVALGSVATLRPWMMRGLIKHAKKVIGKHN